MTSIRNNAAQTEAFRDETPWDIGDDGDTLHEECGIFGVIGARSASSMVALGLHALQHRGQEAVGITSFDGAEFFRTAASAMSPMCSIIRTSLPTCPA
jgi:amidophosphoribosyltransferase